MFKNISLCWKYQDSNFMSAVESDILCLNRQTSASQAICAHPAVYVYYFHSLPQPSLA